MESEADVVASWLPPRRAMRRGAPRYVLLVRRGAGHTTAAHVPRTSAGEAVAVHLFRAPRPAHNVMRAAAPRPQRRAPQTIHGGRGGPSKEACKKPALQAWPQHAPPPPHIAPCTRHGKRRSLRTLHHPVRTSGTMALNTLISSFTPLLSHHTESPHSRTTSRTTPGAMATLCLAVAGVTRAAAHR
jgi:hypothetical protein